MECIEQLQCMIDSHHKQPKTAVYTHIFIHMHAVIDDNKRAKLAVVAVSQTPRSGPSALHGHQPSDEKTPAFAVTQGSACAI